MALQRIIRKQNSRHIAVKDSPSIDCITLPEPDGFHDGLYYRVKQQLGLPARKGWVVPGTVLLPSSIQ